MHKYCKIEYQKYKTSYKRNSKKYYDKHKEQYAIYAKKWRKNNKAYIRAQKAIKIAEKYALINKLKNKPCADCQGWFDFVCMEFDHRDPKTKVAPISRMIANGRSNKAIFEEIAKCDLVCGNCHAIRTAKQHKLGVFKHEQFAPERRSDTLRSQISRTLGG